MADEEALRGLGHVFADFTAVIGNQGASPPKMGYKNTGAVCIVFVSGLAVTVSAPPALMIFIPGQLLPLEGGKGLGYLVAQGGAVAFPLPVLRQPTWHGPVLCRGRKTLIY